MMPGWEAADLERVLSLAPLVLAPFIGSFLSVLVVRLPKGVKVGWSRSRCQACGHVLGVVDLIPLLSWLALRGRCRHCGQAIGPMYLFLELAALAIAIWAFATLDGWLLWATCVLGWTLLGLAVLDHYNMILPDALTLPLLIVGLGVAVLIDPAKLPAHGIGVIVGYFAFAGIGWLYARFRGRAGLGMGDAKLLAAGGAWLSWLALPSVVFIAAALALGVALVASVAGRVAMMDKRIPFGPYLASAIWITWLYGPLTIG